MLRHFLRDKRGNYLMITALVMPVLFGSLTIGVDYAEMSRRCQNTVNAVDAATFATARRLLEGIPQNQAQAYAREFFHANLSAAAPEDVALTITLPDWRGLRQLQLHSVLTYRPYFLGAFLGLLGRDQPLLQCRSTSTVQMQNTVEAVLVLDNSTSMYIDPTTGKNVVSGGKSRMDLLKNAATQLVDQLADVAKSMVQVEKPVQLAVVPFASSVNVGPQYGPDDRSAKWLDTQGDSPVHHENFSWPATIASDRKVEVESGTKRAKKVGSGWKDKEGSYVTRFSLFKDLQKTICDNGGTSCANPKVVPLGITWKGCVEARPYPYNTNDEAPSSGNPETLFVPMFAPDEAGDYNGDASQTDNLVDRKEFSPKSAYSSNLGNDWWDDSWNNKNVSYDEALARQRSGKKYFIPSPLGHNQQGDPNLSCSTKPITPLADIATEAGKTTIKQAIAGMVPSGNTNVPEAFAWGWRVLSNREPFTNGRPEHERGNDKVIILLTDGANTYDRGNALADNRSTYGAYAYAYLAHEKKYGRIFQGVARPPSASTPAINLNFPVAMNDHFLQTCKNANGGGTNTTGAGLIVMTVALDLSEQISSEKTQIDLLSSCASQSRYSQKKLFWNAKSENLNEVFRQIADELSNMRLIN